MSLRIRVLALVFVTNLIVFGGGALYWVQVQLDEQVHEETRKVSFLSDVVALSLPNRLDENRLNVAHLLDWSGWSSIEDALVVDNNLHLVNPSGDVIADGMELNPVGIKNRDFDFDRAAVLAACYQAERSQAQVPDVAGGLVVPILQPWGDQVYWAAWIRSPELDAIGVIMRRLLPWFLLSTLTLTLGSYLSLRKLVLDPVARLARGARSIQDGDLSVRLEEPDRRDELAELVRGFNKMVSTVQGYQEHLGDEVERMTGEARRAEAAAMAQRRLAAMGELAAGIAHEINNPLGGLQNAVSTLGRSDLPEEKRKRYLGLLENGLQRIGETVSRLRRFTPREAAHEWMDLDDVLRDALDLMRHRAERLGIQLLLERAPDSQSRVRGLRNEAGQALLNLLGNALDAHEERLARGMECSGMARVAVHQSSDQGGVILRIWDNALGVGAEELERVQDLFYTTKEVGKGTGLGLGLVNNSMVLHHGEVSLSSEFGVFFEVRLFFPFEGSVGR